MLYALNIAEYVAESRTSEARKVLLIKATAFKVVTQIGLWLKRQTNENPGEKSCRSREPRMDEMGDTLCVGQRSEGKGGRPRLLSSATGNFRFSIFEGKRKLQRKCV